MSSTSPGKARVNRFNKGIIPQNMTEANNNQTARLIMNSNRGFDRKTSCGGSWISIPTSVNIVHLYIRYILSYF
jgi:hypothetical protein